jgi:two-component system chemotaxis response regulator CheY
MRILIAEDDLSSRRFMMKFLSTYGECDVTIDGLETIDAYLLAYKDAKPYDLICLDIMMPKLDGLKTLQTIRAIEKQNGVNEINRVKIIMTTALNDKSTIASSSEAGCEAYAWKPIDTEKFILVMKKIGLIE